MTTNRNNTLKLRAHSIRTLTPSDLRAVVGGINDSSCNNSKSSCGGTKAFR